MSEKTVKMAATRIRDHVCLHNLSYVVIVFHGGEPLLAGTARLRTYIEVLQSEIPCQIEFAIQTNATLLNTDFLELFARFEVRMGISIDGPQKANDRSRVYRKGTGSYNDVRRAIDLIHSQGKWRGLLGGYLAVIDLKNEPEDIYKFMLDLDARSVDFLLPDAHHDSPPWRPSSDIGSTAYGRWLADLFDVWVKYGRDLEIRFLEEIMLMLFGGRSSLEAIGAQSVDLIVIETDGEIEAVDTLKMVDRAATTLGLTVYEHAIDDAFTKPAIFSRMLGFSALCETCRACPYLTTCAGGYLPHRFGNGNGFLNPSVYCHDLQYLTDHIAGSIQQYRDDGGQVNDPR